RCASAWPTTCAASSRMSADARGVPRPHADGRRRWSLAGWVAAVAWAALIFWQSSRPDAGGLLDGLPPGSDKVLHGAAFLVLSALLTLATRRPFVAAALALVYGASDEVHQLFVP